MAAFFAHPDFDPWLANVAGDFGEAVRKGSTHIVFVVYCRKGVHRSISGGSVLFHCVRMDSRVLLASTQHTSALLWSTTTAASARGAERRPLGARLYYVRPLSVGWSCGRPLPVAGDPLIP